MADIGGGTGIVEGIGNVLGMLGDRIGQNNQQQQRQRDLLADHLESQAKEVGDNIMRAGGFDSPDAQPMVQSLGKITERYNALFPPHETPKLIGRLQKFIGHTPAEAKPDARAGMSVEGVMARARRPEFKDTPAGQRQQAEVTRGIAGENAVEANRLGHRIDEADIQHAIQSGLPPEQIDQLKAIKEGVPPTLLRAPAEKSGQWKQVIGKLNGQDYSYWHSESNNENTDIYGRPLDPEKLAGFVPTAKSATKNKQGWIRENGKFVSVMLDANNQKIPGTENYDSVPPASLTGRITTGDYHWVDEDGNVHSTEETRTSRPIAQGGGGGAASASQTPPTAQPPLPAGNAPAPGAAAIPPSGAAKPPQAAAKPPQGAAKPPSGATIPATPKEARDRVYGQKGTPAQTDARKNLDVAEGLLTKANDAWDHPSATKDKMLVISIIRDAAGRFNISEFDKLIQGAGLGNTLQQYANNVTSGELPKGLRKQLVDAARNNQMGAKSSYEASRRPAAGVTSGGGDVDAEIMRLLNQGE